MTWEHSRMKLRMVPPPGDTTPSSTGNDRLAENDSEISLGRLTKKLAGSSGKASRFTTPAYNALASRVIVNQLTRLLPKDSEEINAQVRHLHAKLDAATLTYLTLHRGDERRGQDPDHCRSPHGDSTSSIWPLGECGQGQGEEDLWDVIRNRDAHDMIKNRRQE
jgi:hypothetical protein